MFEKVNPLIDMSDCYSTNNLQQCMFLMKLYDHLKIPEYINPLKLFPSNVCYLIYCINFSKTYSLEDCIRYWGSVSGIVTINYTLSSEFQLDFTIRSTNILIDPSVAFFRFQSSSGIFIGKGSSNSANVQFFGSVFNQITETNTDYNYSMTYKNGVATLTDGTTTQTSTRTLTKLYLLNSQGDSQLKNLKIKPL